MLIKQAFANNPVSKIDIEIFLSHLLGRNRSFVKAFPEFRLNSHQATKLKSFIERRRRHEPLAYILGFKEFYGLKFKVDNRVMIPRPETEELVNAVIKKAYAIPNREKGGRCKRRQLTIVDVGTGSANIAITLAKDVPFAEIIAIEKDPRAYKAAEENISSHKLDRRVRLLRGDLLEPLLSRPKIAVDIVVANLPYVPQPRFKKLAPEITAWEPRVALDGGRDGREIYHRLFKQVPCVLKPGGWFYYEIDGAIFTGNL